MKKMDREKRLNKIRMTLKGKDFLSIEELSKLTGIPRSSVGRYVYQNLKKEIEIRSYGNIVIIKKLK